MALGHEKLDVYRLAISCVAWVFERSEKLNGVHRHARDQWLRASQSIPISIAISIPMKQIPNKTVLDNRLPAPSPNDFGNHNP